MLLNHQDTELAFSQQDSLMLLDEESAITRTASFKTRGRKRLNRPSKVQQILNSLPAGVTYIGPEGYMTEENVLAYAKNPALYKLQQRMNTPEDMLLFENAQAAKVIPDDKR